MRRNSQNSIAGGLAFRPALSYPRQKVLFVFFHQPHQGLISRVFMGTCPENHFRENRREVDPLGGQTVDLFSTIRGIGVGSQNSVFNQPAQTIGEDIGGNAFRAAEKFFVGMGAT